MRYWFLGAGVAFLVFLVAVWLPNWRFLWHLTSSPDFSSEQKISLLTTTVSSFQSNFSPLSGAIVVVIASEIGVYVALLARTSVRSGVGFLGMVAGFFGIGCASCGSVILTSLVGLATATAFLGWLPFRGREFGFLAIGLLGLAIFFLIGKIRANSCKITS